MKKETFDQLRGLVLELACATDVLESIRHALSDERMLPRDAADAVFAAKSYIARISDDLDHVLAEARER